MKYFFIFLFILAFLPLTLACGSEHDEVAPGGLNSINANVIYDRGMMETFYGWNFFMILMQFLVIIVLVLLILLIIKNIKGGNKK